MTETVEIPPGLVAVTTYGSVSMETSQSMLDIQAFNHEQDLKNIAYRFVPGALVDKVRNDCMRAMVRENRGWLLMIDGDMQVPSDAVLRILVTAFHSHPHFDVVGGYCCLRGDLALPTIDTGTGTWESHYPGAGVLEVMRTGAAFLLVKRHVAERMPDPWFALRVPKKPLDALAEVDNFCRVKFDGANPLRHLPGNPWERIERLMVDDPSTGQDPFVPAEVGEDSGFCDRAKMAGLRIAVDTNIPIGHLHKTVIGWEQHKAAMAQRETQTRHFCGLTG